MTKHLTLLLFIGLTFWGCTSDGITVDKEWSKNGDIENEDALTILHNGITREYVLYVPEIYSDDVSIENEFSSSIYHSLGENFIFFQDSDALLKKIWG